MSKRKAAPASVYGEKAKELFSHEPGIVFLNHGAIGFPPNAVIDKRFSLMREQIENPDEWFRHKSLLYYDESVARLAHFIGSNKDDVVLVDNVTTAVSVALKSIRLLPKQKVLVTNHCYLGIRNILHEYALNHDVELVRYHVDIPIKSTEQFLEKFERFMDKNCDINLAVLEHISSPLGIVFPVQKMITVLKRYKVLTVVDGAQVPGQLDLNVPVIGADYYCGSMHKWCFTSLSCAFLWVAKEHKQTVRPLVTSRYYGTDFKQPFQHPGTRDLSAFYTIPTALDFVTSMGGVCSITGYVKELLRAAEIDLCSSLPLKVLQIPDDMKAPCILLLQFPEGFQHSHIKHPFVLFPKHKVRVYFADFDGKYYLRISTSIYCCEKDFKSLKKALEDFFTDPNIV